MKTYSLVPYRYCDCGTLSGRGLVAGPLHLVDVPVGAQQGGIDHADIRAEALDFLRIPEREGIVVAMRDQHAVRADGIQVVLRHLRGGVAVGAVVVVPVLLRHQGGNAEAKEGRARGDGLGGPALGGIGDPLVQSGDSEADPDGEHIE